MSSFYFDLVVLSEIPAGVLGCLFCGQGQARDERVLKFFRNRTHKAMVDDARNIVNDTLGLSSMCGQGAWVNNKPCTLLGNMQMSQPSQ